MKEVEDEEDAAGVVFPSFEGRAEGESPAGSGLTEEDEEEEGRRSCMTVLDEKGEDEGGFGLREKKDVMEDWLEDEGGDD